jgi:hypothetical protein
MKSCWLKKQSGEGCHRGIIMSEIKSINEPIPIKPTYDPYSRITTFGSWEFDESGEIVWKKRTVRRVFNLTLHDWIASPEIIEFEKPETQGLKKEVSTCFIFKKEIPNLEEFGDVKTIGYRQNVSFKVNSNQGDNIWLRECEGKVYLLNIFPDNPQCIEAPHESTENVSFKYLGKPTKISIEEIRKIIKSGNKYLYGRVIGLGSNLEYLTVV